MKDTFGAPHPVARRRVLLGNNIFLLILLIAVCVHEDYAQRAYKRIFLPPERVRTYLDNPHFHEEIDFGSLYPSHPSIVMLGNSLTQKIAWNELLGRCDVVARGVSGDLTDGILARVGYIIALHPKIVFMEGGSNDLDLGRPAAEIVGNLNKTMMALRDAGIVPVLTGIIKLRPPYKESGKINLVVDSVNRRLLKLADKEGFAMIDLNSQVASSGELEAIYARADGCHLTSGAYRIWAADIMHILKINGI